MRQNLCYIFGNQNVVGLLKLLRQKKENKKKPNSIFVAKAPLRLTFLSNSGIAFGIIDKQNICKNCLEFGHFDDIFDTILVTKLQFFNRKTSTTCSASSNTNFEFQSFRFKLSSNPDIQLLIFKMQVSYLKALHVSSVKHLWH